MVFKFPMLKTLNAIYLFSLYIQILFLFFKLFGKNKLRKSASLII